MSWLKNLLTEEVVKGGNEAVSVPVPLQEETPLPALPEPSILPSPESEVLAPVVQPPSKTPLELSIEDVYKMGKAAAGKNSVLTVLQMMEGLKAFPPDQQLAMIRVLDIQDEGWDERTVKQDANQRIKILDKFLGLIDKDVESQSEKVETGCKRRLEENATEILGIDEEILHLQEARDCLNATSGRTRVHCDKTIALLQERGEAKKGEIQAIKQSFLDFLRFFGESV